MKTSCALFLIIAWTILLGGTGYAAQPVDSAKHQRDTKSSDRQTGRRSVSGKNSPHRATNAGKPNRAQPLANKRGQSAIGSGVTTGQKVPNATSDPAHGSRTVTPSVSAARAAHPPNLSGPFGQTPSNGRHRGTNPATVGGTAKSAVRNTGALSGTGVSHKL